MHLVRILVCSRICASRVTIQRPTSRVDRWKTPSTAEGMTTATSLSCSRSTSCILTRTSISCTELRPATSISTRESCSQCASCVLISCIGSSTYTSVTWWPMTSCYSRRTSRLICRFAAQRRQLQQ